MLVAFILTMPGRSSWNGRWSGQDKVYAKVVNIGYGAKTAAKYRALAGHHSYSFGDGWVASVEVREVSNVVARDLRKRSAGFCGYDWMIDSLRFSGSIEAPRRHA